MINREQAVKNALEYIDADKNDFVIVEEATLEEDFGWILFYDSRLHHETGLFRHAIAGNAPLIVERDTGKIAETGTAYPIEHYLTAYRLTGDPHSELVHAVEIEDHEPKPGALEATKLVRQIVGMGLSEAKSQIDLLKSGNSVTILCRTEERAGILAKELRAKGYNCKVSWVAKC